MVRPALAPRESNFSFTAAIRLELFVVSASSKADSFTSSRVATVATSFAIFRAN